MYVNVSLFTLLTMLLALPKGAPDVQPLLGLFSPFLQGSTRAHSIWRVHGIDVRSVRHQPDVQFAVGRTDQSNKWQADCHPFFQMRLRGGRGEEDAKDVRDGCSDGLQGEDEPTTLAEAENVWIRAVDASPKDVALLFDYALFLQDDKKDWLGAERVYKKVIVLEPQNVAALSNYATILGEHRDNLNAAECSFQMALAIDPGDGKALANYAALVLEKRHEPRRAQELYLHALHADPSNTATLYNYAAMLEDHVGDFKGASRMLQVALQIDPASRDIRGRLATVERRRMMAKRARRRLQGESRHAARRSATREGAAGVERERQLFRAAVLLEPSNAFALYDYAALLLRYSLYVLH